MFLLKNFGDCPLAFQQPTRNCQRSRLANNGLSKPGTVFRDHTAMTFAVVFAATKRSLAMVSVLILSATTVLAGPLTSVEDLLAACRTAVAGDRIELAAGTFQLSEPLVIKSGVCLKGAGMGQTVVTHTQTWRADTSTLPDPETNQRKFDRTGYLIHLDDKSEDVEVSDMTLRGPQVHGAIFCSGATKPVFHHLHIQDFMYSGIRTYSMRDARIHDCTFVDAGQRWQKGQPGLKGGITGGGLFMIWTQDSEIWNNRFLRTKTAPNQHYYGIKGRQGKRCRIHHNTIGVNFSIEFPFEGDEDMEIDHNVLAGTVSIPKYAGGPVPASGQTFRLHHNLFRDTYAIEFVRNGVEIDHNLFDFPVEKDHGNLISGFGREPAAGPASFHHNLVSNPGRGVIWINEPYANLTVHNNHIIARTTVTPRTDGLFGFNQKCDFHTFRFANNRIECIGQPRPLFRNQETAESVVENNELINVLHAETFVNKSTGEPVGLDAPLTFSCGVNGETKVEGWTVRSADQ